MTLNIVVVAPIPRARVRMAMVVKLGIFASVLRPWRMSCHKLVIG